MRQQIWTFLHFPFHMGLVLMMEGTNQFISWRHIIEYLNHTIWPAVPLDSVTFNDTALNLATMTILSNTYLGISDEVFEKLNTTLYALDYAEGTPFETALTKWELLLELMQIIFDGYGFEPPASATDTEDPLALISSYLNVFYLIFGYYVISAGLVLIILGVLSWLSHSKGLHESRSHLPGIISKFVIGAGLMLLSTMTLSWAADNLGESAWSLPLVFFLLGIALICNHLPFGSRKKENQLPLHTGKVSSMLPWAHLTKSLSRKPRSESDSP